MNTPFYSIIVVSYNAGEKLSATIKSILSQTFGEYEIIVKDALSTDGSTAKLPEDPRIRLIQGKDRGIYDGMNIALLSSRGEYIYFLNCGDLLASEAVLEKVHAEISRKEDGQSVPAIFYGHVLERRTGQTVFAAPSMSHFAMYRSLPCHQACFYGRELFAERAFDLHFAVRADYEHFLWCVMKKGAAAVRLDLVICDYEGGGFSETKKNRERSAREHEEIARMYFTGKERFLYRTYMIVTLQPLREKIAHGKHTAALYDRIRNRFYGG